MMSKRLFCRAMKEDLRHKLWMISLSGLVGILVHPVMWLMARESLREYIAMLAREGFTASEQVQQILLLYGQETLMLGGMVAVAGAVIVGLFGFRFLFHKNSVDTYHSLPVKRRTLFAVCYLDGFLIWFVPSAVCILAGAAIMGGLLGGPGELETGLGLMKQVLFCLAVSSLAFLLVYNLVLIAVMLSGNVLNTLVSMLMLGVGAIAVWALGTGFFQIYMETFYYRDWGLKPAVYGSPLLSAPAVIYMLYDRMLLQQPFSEQPDVLRMIGINLAVTILLGVYAWLLYRRRDSEHAEQGIRSRAVSAVMRIGGSVGAGMCGWLIFSLLAEENTLVWGSFGAVLAGGLAFGVLDIIFHMEFRAFFAHKIQMLCTLTALLLLCAAFEEDWFGFDTYLPRKEEIEAVGIYHYSYANRSSGTSYDSEEYPLEHIRLRNMETVYPFLECVTDWQKEGGSDSRTDVLWQQLAVKVVLKNGRSYYRNYIISGEDREVLLPLITDEEYLRRTYLLEEDLSEKIDYKMTLARGDSRFGISKADPEILQSVIRAYNQDLLENPENVLTGRGRLLAWLQISPLEETTLDIYDSMERTAEALRQAGLGKWVRILEQSEVASVKLGLAYGYGDRADSTAEDLILAARLTYGIYGEETRAALEKRYREAEEAYYEALAYEEYADTEIVEEYEQEVQEPCLQITEPEEIEELLALVSYTTPSRGINLFQGEYVRIEITDREGKTCAAYLEKGKLPEKYVYRFGNLKY